MALIYKRSNQCQKFGAQAVVAGHRTRFDERHSLPRLPQTRVICFIGQEGERQLPLRPLRAQAQVDTKRLSLRPLAPNQCRETACQGYEIFMIRDLVLDFTVVPKTAGAALV